MLDSDSNYIKNSLAFLNQFHAESQVDSDVNASGSLVEKPVYMDPIWESTYARRLLRSTPFQTRN